ncbi:hypothetical protein CLAFUW4_02349 [Fulvia fulva]|nr:hypothetical protein CLAFUR4_02344 [Fulvia fulva]KAK4632744.1 hypothetical protein CLAFUR0_02348 [Fulvia fulva]WPV11810.1 hypothetical protein CLAFUW4_02349 [Fulvia fulva]WPV25915.1 hypothetical protein CLAFUW7_02349 [Fulvia fulva]
MSPSALLSLPKELRLLIFEHALSDDRPITIGLPSSVPWEGRPQRYHPPLAEVSNLTRHECLPIFYQDKTVILVLRYKEGRQQVEQWFKTLSTNAAIRKHIRYVSIQYFEQPHRSTAMLVDLKTFDIINRESWIHPLLGRPLKTLQAVESALQTAATRSHAAMTDEYIPEVLRELVRVMTEPLQRSRLVLRESMANTRLHGYTDFQLRFEEYVLSGEPLLGVGGYYHDFSCVPTEIYGAVAAKQTTPHAITFVSRQIRAEALSLSYHLNQFIPVVHYRHARNEADKWLASVAANLSIGANLRKFTILHCFGMLDHKGIIDIDLKSSRMFGPRLWCRSIPQSVRVKVETITERASGAGVSDAGMVVTTLGHSWTYWKHDLWHHSRPVDVSKRFVGTDHTSLRSRTRQT